MIDRQKFGQDTEGKLLGIPDAAVGTLGSGNGGSSSGSGCRKVTVKNAVYADFPTTGSDHLFDMYTWTRWCWDRSDYDVYNVTTGKSYDIQHSNWDHDVWNTPARHHYSYVSGHSRSGYKFQKEGKFTGLCPLGVCDTVWAQNNLYSHHNGTWHWSTTEDSGIS